MNDILNNLRSGLSDFWNSQLQWRIGADGKAYIAWPLLLPSGWQVSFSLSLDPLCHVYRLSDEGQTRRYLEDHRVGRGRGILQLIQERCAFYGMNQVEHLLIKEKANGMFSPIEVQLFAEGIQSISHLICREEAQAEVFGTAHRNFEQIIKVGGFKTRKERSLPGKIKTKIDLDAVVETNFISACKVFEIQSDLTRNMEIWAFRMRDIKDRDSSINTMIIYNHDIGHWQDDVMQMGRGICDYFLPYTAAQDITDALNRKAS